MLMLYIILGAVWVLWSVFESMMNKHRIDYVDIVCDFLFWPLSVGYRLFVVANDYWRN